MKDTEYADVLYEHSIRPTSNRIIILRTLARMFHPVSVRELVEEVETIDKSILSRTLALFRAKGLVHVIEGSEGIMLYELCRGTRGGGGDSDEHVHFLCTRCRRTFCLPDTPVPSIDMPEGYRRLSVNCLVKGLCPTCSGGQDAVAEWLLP